MLMRFHWGMGIGHQYWTEFPGLSYSHCPPNYPETTDNSEASSSPSSHPDTQTSQPVGGLREDLDPIPTYTESSTSTSAGDNCPSASGPDHSWDSARAGGNNLDEDETESVNDGLEDELFSDKETDLDTEDDHDGQSSADEDDSSEDEEIQYMYSDLEINE